MPCLTIGGHTPDTAAAAFVAPGAVLAGAVRLGAGASVCYGAVLRADTGRITVGPDTNVQDNAVLHTGPQLDITLGRGVSVGHGAILHGCTRNRHAWNRHAGHNVHAEVALYNGDADPA